MKRILVCLAAALSFTILTAQTPADTTAKKNTQPVVTFTIGDHGDYVHEDTIVLYLSPEVLIAPSAQERLAGCQVQGFTIIYIPKKGKILHIPITGSRLTPAVLELTRKMKAGDQIMIDNIKVINASGNPQTISPSIYTAYNADTRVNLTVSNYLHTTNYVLKAMLLLDETVLVGKDSCELTSFTIKLKKLGEDKNGKSYEIKGNKLTPEIIAEIKSLPAGSKIAFENATVVHTRTKNTQVFPVNIIHIME